MFINNMKDGKGVGGQVAVACSLRSLVRRRNRWLNEHDCYGNVWAFAGRVPHNDSAIVVHFSDAPLLNPCFANRLSDQNQVSHEGRRARYQGVVDAAIIAGEFLHQPLYLRGGRLLHVIL